jgi:hypothetical protein
MGPIAQEILDQEAARTASRKAATREGAAVDNGDASYPAKPRPVVSANSLPPT